MSNFDDLLSAVPIDQVASVLGVDQEQARNAVAQALPAIVGGLSHNAEDDAGASSLADAVNSKDPSVLDGLSLDSIDLDDGAKILQHALGGRSDDVVAALGAQGGQPDLIKKLLPILAPIVLAWLAKQSGGSTSSTGSGGGVLQQILREVLKGAGQGAGSGQQQSTGGKVITDILGQILKGR